MDRPNTLFIIGAGCSRQFTSTDNRIKNIESPLNTDFF